MVFMNWYKISTSKYWGSKASGCLFICKKDRTILLFKRSMEVEQPGTWGLTGGAVPNESGMDEGYMESELEWEDDTAQRFEEPENEIFEDSAKQETREETGTFPSESEFITSTDFTDENFTFRTFIYNLTLEEKESWTPTIQLNWENDSFQWFQKDNLPGNLHFGIEQKLPIIFESFKEQNPFVSSL